jgi:hypothetical protein
MSDDDLIRSLSERLSIPQDAIEIRREEFDGRPVASVVIHDWQALGIEGLEDIVSECIRKHATT